MNWPKVKLGDVCEINIGKTPSRSNSRYWGEGHRWLSIADMNQGKWISNTKEQITDLAIQESGIKKVPANTVLFSFKLSIGKVCLSETEIYTNEAIAALPIKNKNTLDTIYLSHVMKSLAFSDMTDNAVMGATLNKKKLAEVRISLPSIEEQKRIAAILDKADDIRQKREQAIKLADDFLRAKFLEMFGTPANNIHRFPTGKIRDLVDSVNYGTSAKASIDSGEYPILRMGNITYQGGWDFTDLKYLDLSVKEKDKFLVKEGDLLFNRTNSKELVGKTAVYEENRPMAFAGYLIRVRPNPIGNNYYISGYLNSIHGKITLMNMCKSIVGMANINAQELQNIEILIPPKHLQDEYEIIYKKIKKGLSIYDKSAMQLQLLASNLSNEYFM